MENKEITSSATNSKGNKTNKFLVVLIVLLLCFCGYLIWQNLELQKSIETGEIAYTEVFTERNQIQAELEEMLAKYEALETDNQELSAELTAEKEKIEELLKKAKGKDWTIHQLKKETESLRKIMQGFVVQIDSLNQLNNKLTEENKVVKTKLTDEQQKTKELVDKNENLSGIVTVASYLKTQGLTASGIKVKSDNTGKENDRAKKIDKIRTSFTLQKNTITIPGKKWIYVRILTPDGRVLSEKTDDSNKFDFNGVRGLYSAKKEIDYKNDDMSVTIDWLKTDEFPVGEYNVEVYADGVDIGKTKFSLK
jgi:cell division protein FtsB